MITIEIDGKKVGATAGSMLIDVADNAGISIPRFCYHKKLSVVANCRMCLVDVEKSPKPLPACATPIAEGMVVHTKSAKAIANQKSVMEFLLINHPLDCPICDQGGECELQDVAMRYGSDVGRYSEVKRILPHKNAGPLIAMDMTRCIHCTRCVRFGQEIAGEMELGLSGRNDHVQITNYLEKNITSEVSGNLIDVCPVGALTSRPFRYETRTWELKEHPTIAMHDMLGSNIAVHTKHGRIYRVVPRENEEVNEVWLSDRDRFSYEGNYQNRLTKPMLKINDKWHFQSWEHVFTILEQELLPHLSNTEILYSDSLSAEEIFLINKIAEKGSISNADYRLSQKDFTLDKLGIYAHGLHISLEEFEEIESALIIGCNLRKEIPLLNLRLRKAVVNNDAAINYLNPVGYKINYKTGLNLIKKPSEWQFILEKILVSIEQKHEQMDGSTDEIDIFVEEVKQGLYKNAVVILGGIAQNCSNYSNLIKLSAKISKLTDSQLVLLPKGGNSRIASLLNRGNSKKAVTTSILVGVEPKVDIWNEFQQRVDKSKFVVAIATHDSANLRACADLILPSATHFETGGSQLNITGVWQSQVAVVPPPEEAKQCWKILRVLANHLNLEGFDYMNLQQVTDEMKIAVAQVKTIELDALADSTCKKQVGNKTQIELLKMFSPYSVNMLVRNSIALQKTEDAAQTYVVANPNARLRNSFAIVEADDDKRLSVEISETQKVQVNLDEKVADNLLVGCPFSEATMVLSKIINCV